MENKNQPAFARPFSEDRNSGDRPEHYWPSDWLTKREYAAIQLAQGLTTKYNLKEPGDQEIIAKMAIELADSLFTELSKPQ